MRKLVKKIYIKKYLYNRRYNKKDLIYLFNQSSSYNTLGLIFNLPNISELLSNNSLLKCYQNMIIRKFCKKKKKKKKYLLSNLVGKQNKDIIVF